jgi:hypothetical protein
VSSTEAVPVDSLNILWKKAKKREKESQLLSSVAPAKTLSLFSMKSS